MLFEEKRFACRDAKTLIEAVILWTYVILPRFSFYLHTSISENACQAPQG